MNMLLVLSKRFYNFVMNGSYDFPKLLNLNRFEADNLE